MSYVMSWERFAEERGEQRGEAKSLLTLFRAKFGAPEPEVEQRIYDAPSGQLQSWIQRILTAERPEDLFK